MDFETGDLYAWDAYNIEGFSSSIVSPGHQHDGVVSNYAVQMSKPAGSTSGYSFAQLMQMAPNLKRDQTYRVEFSWKYAVDTDSSDVCSTWFGMWGIVLANVSPHSPSHRATNTPSSSPPPLPPNSPPATPSTHCPSAAPLPASRQRRSPHSSPTSGSGTLLTTGGHRSLAIRRSSGSDSSAMPASKPRTSEFSSTTLPSRLLRRARLVVACSGLGCNV
jgi:hypothetical protein